MMNFNWELRWYWLLFKLLKLTAVKDNDRRLWICIHEVQTTAMTSFCFFVIITCGLIGCNNNYDSSMIGLALWARLSTIRIVLSVFHSHHQQHQLLLLLLILTWVQFWRLLCNDLSTRGSYYMVEATKSLLYSIHV